jgi:hypothetical protein
MRAAERVAGRQQALLARSAALRITLARESDALRRPLALADQVRGAWLWLRAHPEWGLGAVVLLAVLRPRRGLGWAVRLWWGWRSWQRLQGWLARP